jgi:rhodanese-related sulfurtransferase
MRLLAALAVLGLTAFLPGLALAQQAKVVAIAPQRVTGTEARKLVAQGALLLDVRTPQEYAEVHLDGARNIPLAELPSTLATLPRDKPIVVYCAVGARATRAAALLGKAGFDARNLGGIDAWNQ